MPNKLDSTASNLSALIDKSGSWEQFALLFLRNSWMYWASASLIGVIIALTLIFTMPPSYRATALVTTMQPYDSKAPSFGIISEGPNEVMARFANPAVFDVETLNLCGVVGSASNFRDFKILPVPNVPTWIQIYVTKNSPETSLQCLDAIYKLVKDNQNIILNSYIDIAKKRISENDTKLEKAKNLVAKADKTEALAGAAYLATRDEIRLLLEETAQLRNIILSRENYTARLIVKPYVEKESAGRRIRSLLFQGLFFGFIFGIFIYIIQKKKKG
jgi:hypothetical protein